MEMPLGGRKFHAFLVDLQFAGWGIVLSVSGVHGAPHRGWDRMRQYLYRLAYRIQWLLAGQMGLDIRKFGYFLRGFPRFVRDYFKFKQSYKGRLNFLPCVHDWFDEGGNVNMEYFWQDLLVARKIFEAKPTRHVDVGSRVDGLVAHVASFRQVEVFDVRPIHRAIPGVLFKQADLMDPVEELRGCCDSLSCLHALEHFGLGRYGDPVDPGGFERGFQSLAGLLGPGGVFYLSFPVGQGRVEFNSHRVVDPRHVLDCAKENALELLELTTIRKDGLTRTLPLGNLELDGLAREWYLLAVFVFKKTALMRRTSGPRRIGPPGASRPRRRPGKPTSGLGGRTKARTRRDRPSVARPGSPAAVPRRSRRPR